MRIITLLAVGCLSLNSQIEILNAFVNEEAKAENSTFRAQERHDPAWLKYKERAGVIRKQHNDEVRKWKDCGE